MTEELNPHKENLLTTQPENDAPVSRYPDLAAEQKMIINIIDEKADDIGGFFHTLKLANAVEEGVEPPYDLKFLTVAETQFQMAFMALRRAITKPTQF